MKIRTKPATGNRRRPRSPGVMLRNRAAGIHFWDDEISADGGKAKLHRVVRHREDRLWRREATLDIEAYA